MSRVALVLTGGTLAGAYVAFGPDLTPWLSDLANQDTAIARSGEPLEGRDPPPGVPMGHDAVDRQ